MQERTRLARNKDKTKIENILQVWIIPNSAVLAQPIHRLDNSVLSLLMIAIATTEHLLIRKSFIGDCVYLLLIKNSRPYRTDPFICVNLIE